MLLLTLIQDREMYYYREIPNKQASPLHKASMHCFCLFSYVAGGIKVLRTEVNGIERKQRS